jgi:hypothetical protein
VDVASVVEEESDPQAASTTATEAATRMAIARSTA